VVGCRQEHLGEIIKRRKLSEVSVGIDRNCLQRKKKKKRRCGLYNLGIPFEKSSKRAMEGKNSIIHRDYGGKKGKEENTNQ